MACVKGRGGPKAKPLSLVKLSGAYRKDRHGSCPDIAPAMISPPAWLKEKAREQWAGIAPILYDMGVLGAPYGVALALLADALADWQRFSHEAESAPSTVTTESGSVLRHPIHAMARAAWADVLKAAREFVLTPSAIRGITRGASTTKDRPRGLQAFREEK